MRSVQSDWKEKKKKTDFKITYCCLITLWITRHTHAKRKWVKSSCARLRHEEFQGQWCSRKILLAPAIEKWNHAISKHHHKAKERLTPPKSVRWGRGPFRKKVRPSIQAWSRQASQAAPARDQGTLATTSSCHHKQSCPWVTTNLDVGCRLWIQSTRDFMHWVPLRWGMRNIYCTEKKQTLCCFPMQCLYFNDVVRNQTE